MQVVIAPAVQFPTSLSLLLKSVLWAYARLQSSSCVNLATSCNLVHVLTFYNFSFLSEPMQVVIAPAVQFPMDLCSASAIQPISFLFCCKSKLFNSKKIANLKSQIPSLAFHSEQHENAQTTLPLYFLSGSSAKLQCCRSRKLHASLLVVQDVHSTWPRFAKETFPESTNITSILFSTAFYQMKCHRQSRQTTLAIIAIKTIELISQPNSVCRYLPARPSI